MAKSCSILGQQVPKFELYKHNDELFNIYYRTFYDYLKNLNEEMQDENGVNDIVFNGMCENPVYDMILNGSITESEIIGAISIIFRETP
jgi:hypothetical protein